MKRPSFQFYPGDWQVNSNLRRCTHAEKGAWLDVMCLMHDQDEYGVLRWPLKEIAQSVGAPIGLLRGLVSKTVMKGSDAELTEAFIYVPRSGRKDGDPVILLNTQAGPIWYSSRMVKDEYVRTIRGESSRFSAPSDEAPEATPKAAPKPPFGDGSSSSSSSSSSIPPSPQGGRSMGVAELKALGVDEQHAKDWLAARKAKRLPLTATAWDRFVRDSKAKGYEAPAAVQLCAERGWAGFYGEGPSQGSLMEGAV
jgi:hypothetical protein